MHMFVEDRYIYEKFPQKYGIYEWCLYPLNEANAARVFSLLINLQAHEDVILSSFRPTVRNEIRQCEKKDEPVFILNNHPSSDDIDNLLAQYETFAKSKNLKDIAKLKNFYKGYFELLCRNNCMIIATATNNSHECSVTDALFINDACEIARLNMSVSNFRNQDKDHQKINSRLNKWLKFKECQYFKNRNIKYYDLGGAPREHSDDLSVDNIREFKLSFSNIFVSFYNFTLPKPKGAWYRFRHKYLRRKRHPVGNLRPQICLLFNDTVNREVYQIVNQLSDRYRFDVRLYKDYDVKKHYDLLHLMDNKLFDKDFKGTKIVKKELDITNCGFCPLEFFYASNRAYDQRGGGIQ